MIVVDSRGQPHLFTTWLTNKYQSLELLGGVGIRLVPIEDWLEAIEKGI